MPQRGDDTDTSPKGRPEGAAPSGGGSLSALRRGPHPMPHFLAAIYALAIVFASLQPFGDWIAPPRRRAVLAVLAGTRCARRASTSIANVIAYLPFGAFVALMPRRAVPRRAVAIGGLAGFAMSFAMESLQAWIPPRDANVIDLAVEHDRRDARRGDRGSDRAAAASAREAVGVAARPVPAGRAGRRRPRAARGLARGAAQPGDPAVRDHVRSGAGARARRRDAGIRCGRRRDRGRRERVPGARRRPLPRAPGAPSPARRRRGAAADRRGAGAEGSRGDPAAQARGVGRLAAARASRPASPSARSRCSPPSCCRVRR